MIFTPTWQTPQGTAMQEQTRRMIERQTVLGASTPSTSSGGGAAGSEWVIGTENPHPIGAMANVLHQYQKGRDVFLASKHDAMLMVEHDNVLPDEGAAQRLLDTDADVVYGLYLLRHGTNVINAWRYENDWNIGMPLNRYPLEMRDARKAGAWRVSGVGFGCTLIRRHVLEQIAFHGGGGLTVAAPDMPFAQDALRAGFVSICRFDVQVGHIENGRLLMPFGESNVDKKPYVCIQAVNAMVGETWVRLIEGERYLFTVEEAHDLVRCGYLRGVAGEDFNAKNAKDAEGEKVEEATVEAGETAVAPVQRRKTRKGAA